MLVAYNANGSFKKSAVKFAILMHTRDKRLSFCFYMEAFNTLPVQKASDAGITLFSSQELRKRPRLRPIEFSNFSRLSLHS